MQSKSFKDVHKVVNRYMPKIGEVNWFFALEDMKDLLTSLGNPQDQLKIIHVAGTSGKTSTCYFVTELLHVAGKKVGLTVSPHVSEINERLQIDGKPLDEKSYCALFEEFINVLPKTKIRPTYFGLLAAFAFWAFAKLGVDYAVVEVGMGGRLDATNVIQDPQKVCIITDIGLDHTQFLGDTPGKIATEKAGIIGQHNAVFMAVQSDEVLSAVAEVAHKKHAQIHMLYPKAIDEAPKQLPPFQKRNWTLAKAAVEYVATRDNFELSTKQYLSSANITIPARMEKFRLNNKLIIIDGAHNTQKITALCEGISEQYPNKSVASLVSFVEGKDTTLQGSLSMLSKISTNILITKFDTSQDLHRRAIVPDTIAKTAKKVGFKQVQVVASAEEALNELLAQPEDIKLITGSFFLAHQLRPSVQVSAK